MGLDLSKNYSNWINGFTKEQFDILVKEFIKIHLNIENVVLVDGTGDGGIDLKLLDQKGKKRKIPIQITIEKKVYYKLKNDLLKIAKLIEDHDYSDSFYFFYSSSSSETLIDDLIDEARDLGVTLIPFDSKVIGEFIQRPKYLKLRDIIRQTLGNFVKEENAYFDKFDKMKFDLVSYSDDSFEIKNRTITSFILFELYQNDKGLIVDSIKNKITEKFQLTTEDHFVERLINKLEVENKITSLETLPKTVSLTTDERSRIESIKEEVDFQEQYFIHRISDTLKLVNLQNKIKEIIDEIYELYKSNYIKDYLEINEISDNGGFKIKMVEDFKNYLDKICGGKVDSKKLAEDILEICSYNNFLQKLGAGELFSTLIKSVEIDQYLNRQPKTVYLDTSVLIYAICYLYNQHSEYDDVHFKVAKDIMIYQNVGKTRIKLYVPKTYVQEAALHLQSAVNLVPFTKLHVFDKLGTSSNIYYNYFLYQKSNGELNEDIENFSDYLIDLGIEVEYSFSDQLLNYLTEFLTALLEDAGIAVFDFYPYYAKDKRKLEEIEKELAYVYSGMSSVRTKSAHYNDTLMLCELYDEDVDKTDPTLLTFDNSFWHFRKKYQRKHPNAPYWYLFRPAKYLDHLSLINFQINSDALIKDIYTIMDDESDIQNKVRYLNDALTRLVDLRTKSGVKLTIGLAEIRSNKVYSINIEEKERDKTAYLDAQPIDDFFINLSRYYIDKKGKYDLKIFKLFLSKEEVVDSVLDYFKGELPIYSKLENRRDQESIFKKMDVLIEKSIQKPAFEILQSNDEQILSFKNVGSVATGLVVGSTGTSILPSLILDKHEAGVEEVFNIDLGEHFRILPSENFQMVIGYADGDGNRYQQVYSKMGTKTSISAPQLLHNKK